MLNSRFVPGKNTATLIIPFFLSLAFLLYKYAILNTGLYKSDLYSFYQNANDWLIDKPIYFENTFGQTFLHHTYYLTPVLAPFTFLFGIGGLFIAQILCIFFAIRALILCVEQKQKWQFSILISALVFGPLGFFLWDNMTYGWHLESLIFPLSLWAGAQLYRDKKWSAFLLLFILSSIKEDAVFQAAAVYSMHSALLFFQNKLSKKQIWTRLLTAYALALILFAANMTLIHVYSQNERVAQSAAGFEQLLHEPQNMLPYLSGLTKYFFLLLLAIPLFLLAGRRIPAVYFSLFLFLIPALFFAFVSGLFYYPQLSFSLFWPPRLFYSSALIILATLFILFVFLPNALFIRLPGLLILQAFALHQPDFNRYYNDLFFIKIALGKEISPQHSQMLQSLNCVSGKMQERTSLVVDEYLAFAFQNHDFILSDPFISSYKNPPQLAILRNRENFKKIHYFEPADSVLLPQLIVYFAQENHPLKQEISNCSRQTIE